MKSRRPVYAGGTSCYSESVSENSEVRHARLVGREAGTGYLVMEDPADETRWYVTECCLASAKGSMGGVVCRACYAEVDPGLGGVPVYAVEAIQPAEENGRAREAHLEDHRRVEGLRRANAKALLGQYERGVITTEELAMKLVELCGIVR